MNKKLFCCIPILILPILLILLLVLFVEVDTAIPQTQPVWETEVVTSETLWNTVQTWRKSQGLNEYVKDENLCTISDARANEVQTDYSHDGFLKHIPLMRFPVSTYISENLSRFLQYADNTTSILDSWLYSPPHRKALETDYKYSCISVQGNYAVQIFSNCEDYCPRW